LGAVFPEFNVSIYSQSTPFDQLPTFLHQILYGELSVTEYVQVVADDMPVSA
jgi:hypothetical protein